MIHTKRINDIINQLSSQETEAYRLSDNARSNKERDFWEGKARGLADSALLLRLMLPRPKKTKKELKAEKAENV